MESKKERLTANLADKKAKQAILKKIAASTDEGLGKGKFWHSAGYMREIGFADLIDILFFYISLRPDLRDFVAGIQASDFVWRILEAHWDKRSGELFPFIGRSPWANGPGPWGGTAGPAESYFLMIGFFDKTLLAWFLWPEELKMESYNNWPRLKSRIEKMLFPKLRRRYNQKKLEAALVFAKEICEVMRQKAEQKAVKP